MTFDQRRSFLNNCICLLAFLIALKSAGAADKAPLKVFILAGQSNMQGHAEVRTFKHLDMDPKTAPLLKLMQDEQGRPTICDDVWISSIGSSPEEKFGQLTVGYGPKGRDQKIGPEFLFGIQMHQLLNEPILIIKTAWGGKSLHTDFRPPSAGPYEFTEQQLQQARNRNRNIEEMQAEKQAATGFYYRAMVEHVNKVLGDIQRIYPDYNPSAGYQLAGFVWFQGWNDMVDGGVYPNRSQPGGYDAYTDVMTHFINDVRKDLKSPELPFVIGVLGVGGPVSAYGPEEQRYVSTHQNFRNAMAAAADLPQFQDTVVAVRTENFWDMQLKDLRKRDSVINATLKKMQKAGTLARQDVQQKRETMRAEEFTEQELKALTVGVSNAEYHYLGSAKIMAQIGRGFADALYSKMQK